MRTRQRKSSKKLAVPPWERLHVALPRVLIAAASVVVLYLLILAVELYRYHQLPAPKKDLRIRQEIVARFPRDYEVTIRSADLLGLGDRFYVAGGNDSFVSHAYVVDEDSESDLKKNEGKVNYPSLKLFYVREPGFLSALLAVLPFFNVERQFIELSLKEYYELTPIPFMEKAGKDPGAQKREYEREFSFPSTFSLLDFQIFDPEGDGQERIVTHWLSYAGGSGGTKWSAILDFINGELKVVSGYPDLLNVSNSTVLWAILRYSGVLRPEWRDTKELGELRPVLEFMGLSGDDITYLITRRPAPNRLESILDDLNERNPVPPDKFLNLWDHSYIELFSRHTDNFAQFIPLQGKYVFADAFYIEDSSCHWCPHLWRVMSFFYRGGRWISDRVVNGSRFNGVWLDESQRFTLNDVFGTYEDQGPMGLAFSFLSPDWTPSSKRGISDPWGLEMRMTSPVEKRIKALHLKESE